MIIEMKRLAVGCALLAALGVHAQSPSSMQFQRQAQQVQRLAPQVAPPTASRQPSITVGDMTDPEARRQFALVSRRLCGAPIAVIGEPVAGATMAQSPPPGSIVACADMVTLTATLPPRRGGNDASWTMPALETRDDEAALQADAQRRCDGRSLALLPVMRPSDKLRGTLLLQTPEAGAAVGCASLVVVARSRGPRGFVVGPLNDAALVARFEQRASAFCRRPFTVVNGTDWSAAASGSFLSQDPSPDTMFACAMTVTVIYSKGLQPWPMPDLGVQGADARLVDAARQRGCTGFAIAAGTAYASAPAGSFVSQSPPPGTAIDCATPVSSTRSQGPKPFAVGPLDTPQRRNAFERRATQFCGTPVTIDFPPRLVRDAPEASFVGQTPAPGAQFACGARVAVTLSTVPPPTLPEPPSPAATPAATLAPPLPVPPPPPVLMPPPPPPALPPPPSLAPPVRAVPAAPPACGIDRRPLFDRLVAGEACHPALVPWWVLALGGLIVGGLVVLVARPLFRGGGGGGTPPPAHVVAGVARLDCAAATEGLTRGAPDIVIAAGDASVAVAAETPLPVESVEVANG